MKDSYPVKEKKRKMLVFDTMKMTLRHFLGDSLFRELVLKIVEFNDTSSPTQEINCVLSGVANKRQIENDTVNLILLDKIFENERVIMLLNRIQLQHILQHMPREFLKPDLEDGVMKEANASKLITLVKEERKKLVDDKIKDQSFEKNPKLKQEFD